MIITYLYNRSSIGLGLGIYTHDLKKHDPEYMDFYQIYGEEHNAWYDLHIVVHSIEQFDKFEEKYKMVNMSNYILQPFIYQEMQLTIKRYKLSDVL